MPTRSLSLRWLSLALAICACDDPAPIVLGRLQSRVPDAGSELVDAGEREPQHQRDPSEGGRDPDDDHERDRSGDRE